MSSDNIMNTWKLLGNNKLQAGVPVKGIVGGLKAKGPNSSRRFLCQRVRRAPIHPAFATHKIRCPTESARSHARPMTEGRKVTETREAIVIAEQTEQEARVEDEHGQGASFLGESSELSAEDLETIVAGAASHAEGQMTTASGDASHAER